MQGNQDSTSDRRHCLRQSVHVPAFASFDGVTGGMILDLSEEGLSMQTAAPLESRRQVQLHLDLPEPAGHLETTGYIAWADALGRAGVRFSDLPEESRRRLNEWLTVNASAPSRMAPKLALGGTARSGAFSTAGGAVPIKAIREHLAISLEPEMEMQEQGFRSPLSRTVQYEFNSLGSDLNTALRLIGERARSLTRGTSAAIALTHKGTVMCRASIGGSAPSLGTRLDVNCGFSGECFRTGKSLRCDDAETDPRVDLASCQRAGIRSILAAPIRYEREIVGLLAVFGTKSFSFDEGDVAVVESLAHTVVLAMSQASALRRG
jgi:hypothetical protein